MRPEFTQTRKVPEFLDACEEVAALPQLWFPPDPLLLAMLFKNREIGGSGTGIS